LSLPNLRKILEVALLFLFSGYSSHFFHFCRLALEKFLFRCLVFAYPFASSPIVAPRPFFAPVSRTRLLLYPFPEPANSRPRALKKLPHTSTDYTSIRSQMKYYCIITQALLVISLLSFLVVQHHPFGSCLAFGFPRVGL
jgi:hypothetical protein